MVAEIVAGGGRAVASHDDVSSEDGARRLVEMAVGRFGGLDGVVNNAGILRSGLLLRTSAADFRAVLEVHLVGTFLVTQAAGRHWRGRSQGSAAVDARVVNTSSSAALYGFVGEAAYSSAKAGIAGFTLTAAAELARYGVTVNAVAPSALTRLTAWADPGSDAQAARGRRTAPDRPANHGRLELGRPESVSPLVVWLMSPLSSGVTGRVFEAGGGEITVGDGWKPGRPISHSDDPDLVELGGEVCSRLAEAATAVPVFVPGRNERSA